MHQTVQDRQARDREQEGYEHQVPRKLMSAAEVAQVLGVKLHRVYELARIGTIPAVRLGRQVRFDPRAIEDWIRSGGQALPPNDATGAETVT